MPWTESLEQTLLYIENILESHSDNLKVYVEPTVRSLVSMLQFKVPTRVDDVFDITKIASFYFYVPWIAVFCLFLLIIPPASAPTKNAEEDEKFVEYPASNFISVWITVFFFVDLFSLWSRIHWLLIIPFVWASFAFLDIIFSRTYMNFIDRLCLSSLRSITLFICLLFLPLITVARDVLFISGCVSTQFRYLYQQISLRNSIMAVDKQKLLLACKQVC